MQSHHFLLPIFLYQQQREAILTDYLQIYYLEIFRKLENINRNFSNTNQSLMLVNKC